MNLTEKASYIHGLVEGMDFDTTTKEGKVIAALLDLVSDLSTAVSGLADDVEQIYDELDAIDEDLTDVEDYVFDAEEEEECDGCCEDCDEACGDDDVYEITCPQCGEVAYLTAEELCGEELNCPKCGVKWEAEFAEEDSEEE